MRSQVLTEAGPEEMCVRIARLQMHPLRATANDDFGSVPWHLEEGPDVLLHRHAANAGSDGPREIQEALVARTEQIGIDAAPPGGQIGKSTAREFAPHRGRADHATNSTAVKPAQHPVAESDRNRVAGAQILRELGVEGSCEREFSRHAIAARGHPQRALGGDVHGLGQKLCKAGREFFGRAQREPDFRIGGARDAPELGRGEQIDVVTEASHRGCGGCQGADHAVGLRQPRIGHDHDPHTLCLMAAKGRIC